MADHGKGHRERRRAAARLSRQKTRPPAAATSFGLGKMRASRARRAGLRPKSLIFHRCLRQAHRIAAANEGNPDSDAQRVGKQGNETAAPQLPMGMRSATLTERPSGPTFDSLWPKSPRPGPSAPSPPASTQAPAVSAADSQQSTDQSIDVASQASGGGGSMPVSIVKSGVVNGMAYILYSDGSIEAQLPQGTLRFGSIIELRNHIENSA